MNLADELENSSNYDKMVFWTIPSLLEQKLNGIWLVKFEFDQLKAHDTAYNVYLEQRQRILNT